MIFNILLTCHNMDYAKLAPCHGNAHTGGSIDFHHQAIELQLLFAALMFYGRLLH